MRITPQFRMNIQKVGVITIFYVLIDIFTSFFSRAILNSPFSLGPSEEFVFKNHLMINIIAGIVAGLLGGSMLVTVNSKVFRKKSFGFALRVTAASFIVIFLIVAVMIGVMNKALSLGPEASFNEILISGLAILKDEALIMYFVLWFGITMFTLFLLQVNDKFGPGILKKFLLGQYFTPKEEERIFMFIDMRSSTTIAEKIGNEKYFKLLSELFTDVTGTILNTEGEIYQYVGDEIVITWPMKKGLRNANCIRCFTLIQQLLKDRAHKYKEKFGVSPEFKAGVHFGKVTAGEIGQIKKEIIYSGDVLNTTARIQEQCNAYGVDFLISRETYDLVLAKEQYELVPLGHIDLRGKHQKININTVKLLD